jgi:hypothetical protein
VVGLAVGGGFAWHAVATNNEADATGCRGKHCLTEHGVELRHAAHDAGNLATVGVSVGVLGLATAAALLWVVPELGQEPSDGKSQNAALELTPVLAPGACALFVSSQF